MANVLRVWWHQIKTDEGQQGNSWSLTTTEDVAKRTKYLRLGNALLYFILREGTVSSSVNLQVTKPAIWHATCTFKVINMTRKTLTPSQLDLFQTHPPLCLSSPCCHSQVHSKWSKYQAQMCTWIGYHSNRSRSRIYFSSFVFQLFLFSLLWHKTCFCAWESQRLRSRGSTALLKYQYSTMQLWVGPQGLAFSFRCW